MICISIPAGICLCTLVSGQGGERVSEKKVHYYDYAANAHLYYHRTACGLPPHGYGHKHSGKIEEVTCKRCLKLKGEEECSQE